MEDRTWSYSLYGTVPLRKKQFQTRLLRILPGKGDDMIKCILSTSTLIGELYEALSYTWGLDEPNNEICVNKVIVKVTSNLRDALFALRHENTSRLIWVDALCINQDSVPERNYQVQHMGHIYHNAHRVIVWLGAAAEDSEFVFRYIHHVLGKTNGTGQIGVCSSLALALKHFFRRRYWTRVWVVQEIAQAIRTPMLLCGKDSLAWSEMVKFADRFVQTARIERNRGTMNFLASIDHVRLLQAIRERVRTPPRLRLGVEGRIPEPEEVRAGYEDDLFYFFNATAKFEATDPRDKIFALISMTRGVSAALTSADYKRSVVEVFIDTAKNAITRSMSLDVLSHKDNGLSAASDLRLPSWVPDFSLPRKTNVPSSEGFKRMPVHQGLLDIGFGEEGEEYSTLDAYGLYLDQITSQAELEASFTTDTGQDLRTWGMIRQDLIRWRYRFWEKDHEDPSSEVDVLPEHLITTEDHQRDWAEFLFTFSVRLHETQRWHCHQEDLNSPCSRSSIAATLTKDLDLLAILAALEGDPDIPPALAAIKKMPSIMRALRGDLSPPSVLGEVIKALRDPENFSRTLLPLRGHETFLEAIMHGLETGTAIETPRYLQNVRVTDPRETWGFLKALIEGADTPAVLEALKQDLGLPPGTCPWPAGASDTIEGLGRVFVCHRFLNALADFKAFRTAEGSRGVFASQARVGDHIVFFHNTSAPKILRPFNSADSGDEIYEVIGDAYVHWPDIETLPGYAKVEAFRRYKLV